MEKKVNRLLDVLDRDRDIAIGLNLDGIINPPNSRNMKPWQGIDDRIVELYNLSKKNKNVKFGIISAWEPFTIISEMSSILGSKRDFLISSEGGYLYTNQIVGFDVMGFRFGYYSLDLAKTVFFKELINLLKQTGYQLCVQPNLSETQAVYLNGWEEAKLYTSPAVKQEYSTSDLEEKIKKFGAEVKRDSEWIVVNNSERNLFIIMYTLSQELPFIPVVFGDSEDKLMLRVEEHAPEIPRSEIDDVFKTLLLDGTIKQYAVHHDNGIDLTLNTSLVPSIEAGFKLSAEINMNSPQVICAHDDLPDIRSNEMGIIQIPLEGSVAERYVKAYHEYLFSVKDGPEFLDIIIEVVKQLTR